MTETIKVITEFNEGLNLTPKYHAYNGGWANVNKCADCEMVGLSEDMFTIDPCPNCGGKTMSGYVGRWTGNWKNDFFKSGWSDGVWEMRKGVEK